MLLDLAYMLDKFHNPIPGNLTAWALCSLLCFSILMAPHFRKLWQLQENSAPSNSSHYWHEESLLCAEEGLSFTVVDISLSLCSKMCILTTKWNIVSREVKNAANVYILIDVGEIKLSWIYQLGRVVCHFAKVCDQEWWRIPGTSIALANDNPGDVSDCVV